MSDMPEQLWCWSFNTWDKWGGYSRPTDLFQLSKKERDTGAIYRRDDAPLTPAEAMARCPEVAALVEAVQNSEDDLGAGTWNSVWDALTPFTEDTGNG